MRNFITTLFLFWVVCIYGQSDKSALKVPSGHSPETSNPVPAEAPFDNNPDAYCQEPDQMEHGGVFAATSDLNPSFGFVVSENYVPSESGYVTAVAWWGIYYDFNSGMDCSPGPGDNFTVSYSQDNAGMPGVVIGGPFNVSPAKMVTGEFLPPFNLTEYIYEANHPPVYLTQGQQYWVTINNNLANGNCAWLWETAPPGDSKSYQTMMVMNGFDLALCLDISQPIPTLSQWGFIILGLVLVILGIVVIREKSHQISKT